LSNDIDLTQLSDNGFHTPQSHKFVHMSSLTVTCGSYIFVYIDAVITVVSIAVCSRLHSANFSHCALWSVQFPCSITSDLEHVAISS